MKARIWREREGVWFFVVPYGDPSTGSRPTWELALAEVLGAVDDRRRPRM